MNAYSVHRVSVSMKSHCCHLFLLLDQFPHTGATRAQMLYPLQVLNYFQRVLCSPSYSKILPRKGPLATQLGLNFILVILFSYPPKCNRLREAFSETSDEVGNSYYRPSASTDLLSFPGAALLHRILL